VNPPFGEENIIVYASVSELGDLKLKDEGSIFAVQTRSKDIGVKTRSVKIKAASDDAGLAAEFSEVKAVVKTRK
jgi:hypothetical protein